MRALWRTSGGRTDSFAFIGDEPEERSGRKEAMLWGRIQESSALPRDSSSSSELLTSMALRL
jgi:hypothetical protein